MECRERVTARLSRGGTSLEHSAVAAGSGAILSTPSSFLRAPCQGCRTHYFKSSHFCKESASISISQVSKLRCRVGK